MSCPQPTPPPIITDAERLLRLIAETSDSPGALEIVAGCTKLDDAGQPTSEIELLCWTRHDTSTPHTRRFAYIDTTNPATIAAAIAYARDLRNTYGNVYFSRCLYEPDQDGKYRRDERYAIPNRLVFVDDVAPAHAREFAVYIQTSESSGHGYMLLDRPLNAVQYADIARRLAMHYGGDPSGVDYVQLGRWPNTINTKGHTGREGYRVRLMHYYSATTTSLDALRAALPCPVGHRGSTYAPRPSQVAPGDWCGLPDGVALITSGRWQWMCRMRPQIRQLLMTHEPVQTSRSGGQVDTTPSAQRAALVSNLLQLHYPPPLAEIRAVALALQPHLGTGQADAEYRDAIDREIATYLHVHFAAKDREYRPTPTTGARTAQAPQAQVAPRPRGRVYQADQTRAAQLDKLRAILRNLPTNDYGAIVPDIAAIAAELGKSARMLRNYLHDLEGQKEIKFAASGRGRQLALILTNRFGMPNQDRIEKEIKSAPIAAETEPVCPIETPDSPVVVDLPMESTGDHDLGVYVLSQDSAHVSNSDAGDNDLVLMAQEYHAAPQLGRKRVDELTGEVKTRRSARHFAELVQAEQPGRYSADECMAAYDAERSRLDAIARAELAAYKRRLWQMPDAELITHIRSGLRAEVAALARQGQIAYLVGHYRLRHKIAGEIAGRRRIEITPTTARRRRDAQQAALAQADMFALTA